MLHRSVSRGRLGLASVGVLALLVLSTGSVAAAPPPAPANEQFMQQGKSAELNAGGCTSNGDGTTTCATSGISVFVGRMSDTVTKKAHVNQVCVFVADYTYDDDTGEPVGESRTESGCRVDLPKGSVTFGAKLSWAMLAPTTVSIEEQICDELSCQPGASRNVRVAGTWTGVGPTFFHKYTSVFDDGTCRYDSSGTGTSRDATFVGTLDGESLDQEYAAISDGKSRYRTRCVEG